MSDREPGHPLRTQCLVSNLPLTDFHSLVDYMDELIVEGPRNPGVVYRVEIINDNLSHPVIVNEHRFSADGKVMYIRAFYKDKEPDGGWMPLAREVWNSGYRERNV